MHVVHRSTWAARAEGGEGRGRASPRFERPEPVLPVLTVEAVEGAGVEEDGQVRAPFFRPGATGELRVPLPRSAGAYPVRDTVGGKGGVVPGELSLSGGEP